MTELVGLQALDEEYLKVDAQFGGTDQRKIFTYAEKLMPQLGYKKRAHLMNFMVPGLMGSKMSSSDPDSKIDLLDDAKVVEKKIKKAFCEEGNIVDNGLLSFAKFVILPLKSLQFSIPASTSTPIPSNSTPSPISSITTSAIDAAAHKFSFTVVRAEAFGGSIEFSSYKELEQAFLERKVHPSDLKKFTADAINQLLEPIRHQYRNDVEFQQYAQTGYPAPLKASKVSVSPGCAGAQKQGPGQVTDAFHRFDLRVAKIHACEQHPDADSLYVLSVDVGASIAPSSGAQETPGKKTLRTIVSGLVKYYSKEELCGRSVVVVANLKASKLRGIVSEGMILAASNEADECVELLQPPKTCLPGDLVFLSDETTTAAAINLTPDISINSKQKFFNEVLQSLSTMKLDDKAVSVTYKGKLLCTKSGHVTVASLLNAIVR